MSDELRAPRKRSRSDVVEALKTVYDPEIPVDIYELGLIYNVDVRRRPRRRGAADAHLADVPGRGLAAAGGRGEGRARSTGVTASTVDLVWDPPWEPSMMSEAAKLELGMM